MVTYIEHVQKQIVAHTTNTPVRQIMRVMHLARQFIRAVAVAQRLNRVVRGSICRATVVQRVLRDTIARGIIIVHHAPAIIQTVRRVPPAEIRAIQT